MSRCWGLCYYCLQFNVILNKEKLKFNYQHGFQHLSLYCAMPIVNENVSSYLICRTEATQFIFLSLYMQKYFFLTWQWKQTEQTEFSCFYFTFLQAYILLTISTFGLKMCKTEHQRERNYGFSSFCFLQWYHFQLKQLTNIGK